MVKGVNKRIIEVINPEDKYFEKVILFLSPQSSPDTYTVQKHVDSYLSSLDVKSRKKRRLRPWVLFAFQMTAAAAAGGILVAVVNIL